MKNRTLFFRVCLIGLTPASAVLAGCHLLGSRATEAYNEYQAAEAAGDLNRAEIALMMLVNERQDVPDYWIELGKIQLQLGQYAQAYDALAHAHELDRTNVEVLATLTQLALLSHEVDLADEDAKELALLAPDHPTVTLVRGYVALRTGDLNQADAQADKLLASAPDEPNAKILKARILIDRQRIDEAIKMLEQQHQTVPGDRSAMRALSALYRSRDDWSDVARIQGDLHKLDPNDSGVSQALIEALLRSGNVAAAAGISQSLLSRAGTGAVIDGTLDLWARFASPGSVMPDATKLATISKGAARVSFASYFNSVGQARLAAALLGAPRLPVSPANARWNAVMAQSLALLGRSTDAKQLFDRVLASEPDQVEALRGRATLEVRTGLAKQAIVDAQRLVSATPKTGADRLLLAQTYLAAGNKPEARRTLWQAFQDLPDDERVFAALRADLLSAGDIDGERRLSDEFADERLAKLRELV